MKTILIDYVWRFVRHNKPLMIALFVCVLSLVSLVGCETQVASILTPEKMVNRMELGIELAAEEARLEQELDALIVLAKSKMERLDKEDVIKAKIAEVGLAYASGGIINPIGIASTLMGILGVGAVINSVKKDVVIGRVTGKNI